MGTDLPNAMIIGAQKCGTTTLHQLLASHPEVYLPSFPQEIHFFDLDANYLKGSDWYRRLFAGGQGHEIVAQTSPLYMYLPEVPARIHEVTPDCKFIAILRDPVERAYSHYWHEVRWGFESLPIDVALELEAERIAESDHNRRHFSYVDRGRYPVQLDRFRNVFSPAQVYIVFQNDMREDPLGVGQQCARFLGIDPNGFESQSEDQKVFNSAKIPVNPRLQRLRPRLERVSPKLAGGLDRINLRDGRYPPVSDEIRRYLNKQFEGSGAELRSLVSDTQPDLQVPW